MLAKLSVFLLALPLCQRGMSTVPQIYSGTGAKHTLGSLRKYVVGQ